MEKFTGIIVATNEEKQAIEEIMNNKAKKIVNGLEFFQGDIESKHYCLVQCGVGKVNAARTTQVLIDYFDIQMIINIGVAGGLSGSLNIGDIVIGKELVQHDFDITAFGHEKGYISQTGKIFKSDKNLIEKCEVIKIFAISNLCFLAEEACFKFRHIGKKCETYSYSNMMYQEAIMSDSQTCAICISYSGVSNELIETAKLLKNNDVPIIAITSIGENDLSKISNVKLSLTTREKSYTKIAGFSTIESISLVLDILYSCYFASNFDNHFAYKTKVAESTEKRKKTNIIIDEISD